MERHKYWEQRNGLEKYYARVVKGDDLRSPAELRVGSNPTGTTFFMKLTKLKSKQKKGKEPHHIV